VRPVEGVFFLKHTFNIHEKGLKNKFLEALS
jgi:hypothetical protein